LYPFISEIVIDFRLGGRASLIRSMCAGLAVVEPRPDQIEIHIELWWTFRFESLFYSPEKNLVIVDLEH
jgi:hypothetical protein